MYDGPFETSDLITTDAGTVRILFHYDQYSESPRDWSNVGRLTIAHRDVIDPDPHDDVAEVLRHVQDGGISTRAACLYLRLALPARVVLPVSVNSYDHTYATGEATDDGMRVDGFTYDTPEGVAECMGPDADTTDDMITAALRDELAVYSAWASGEFVGRVIERLEDPLGDADPDDDDDDGSTLTPCGGSSRPTPPARTPRPTSARTPPVTSPRPCWPSRSDRPARGRTPRPRAPDRPERAPRCRTTPASSPSATAPATVY